MKQLHKFFAAILLTAFSVQAQFGPQGPQFTSPEVATDKKVTFRVHAPKASAVRLSAGDIPGASRAEMTKGENGVWEVTIGPVEPGAYRYNFNVDDVAVIDPKNPATSESNANSWSLVHVPGADFMDTKSVPHGAVSEVTYWSETLKRFRRMHVYTPPGYEAGQGDYPVFYLLHGASDSDNSWSTVGRAGFILDNLIAEKKAKPMLVVMPAGHTGPFSFGRGGRSFNEVMNEFVDEFNADILPHIEKNYRVKKDRQSRAIAGLSMGGAQTLNIAIPNLEKYGFIGVYSSGVFGIAGGGPNNAAPDRSWLERNKAALENEAARKDLKLLWFATGKDDFLVQTTRATVEALKEQKFNVVYEETEGAHTWIVWRKYLRDFAPKLF